MVKQVSINILKNILLPGSLVGAYISIYYNLLIYWFWSMAYDLKKFYVIPFIVIAIIAISIIIYLSRKNYNRKLLYLISGSFLPFIIVSLFSLDYHYDFNLYLDYLKKILDEETQIIFDTIRPDYFENIFKNVKILQDNQNTVHKSKRIICSKLINRLNNI